MRKIIPPTSKRAVPEAGPSSNTFFFFLTTQRRVLNLN